MQTKLLYRCYGPHYQRHWSWVHDEAFLWVKLIVKLLSGKSGETFFFFFFSRIRTDQSDLRELSNGPLSCLEHHYSKWLCEQHKPSDYPLDLLLTTGWDITLKFLNLFPFIADVFLSIMKLLLIFSFFRMQLLLFCTQPREEICKQHHYVITVIKPLLNISLELQCKNANV